MEKLYMIMPAYNEEETIGQSVREWHEVVKNVNSASRLVVINDGSTDSTWQKLKELAAGLSQLEILTKENGGHGQTVLYGYRYAVSAGADYIFQTDSDGQTLPEEFPAFWRRRKKYDAIIGVRSRREDGFSRVFVTKTLKFLLRLIFGLHVPDANTPFRLMKKELLETYLHRMPPGFYLPNVLLTVLFLYHQENVKFLPVTFRPRQGGVNSIHFGKIVKIGFRAVRDFVIIRKTMRGKENTVG